MLFSTLIRGSGLVTIVAALLLIIVDLVALLFILSQRSDAGLLFRATVAHYANVLLLIGLIALYAKWLRALGFPGLLSFLEAAIGMGLEPLHLGWPAMLANVGWLLFGVVCLDAQVYPGAASVLLIIGAGLSGVVNALLESGVLNDSLALGGSAMFIDLIFSTAILWLGFSLFKGRNEGAQHSTQVS